MASYRNLTVQQKIIFSYFDSASSFYSMALKTYFENTYTSTAVEAVAAQLLEVEKAYFSYVNHVETLEEEEEVDPSYQEAFEKAVTTMTKKFGGLTTEEQGEFNTLLETVYAYYVGEYDKLNESGSSQE
jgi:hypothetical protein